MSCQGKAGKCTCPQMKSDFPQIKAQIIHSKLHSLLEGGKSICLASPQPAAGRRGATIPTLHSCYFTNQAWECLCCVFSCCFYTERETPWGQCCEKTEVETCPCTIGRFFLFCTERGKVWPSHHDHSHVRWSFGVFLVRVWVPWLPFLPAQASSQPHSAPSAWYFPKEEEYGRGWLWLIHCRWQTHSFEREEVHKAWRVCCSNCILMPAPKEQLSPNAWLQCSSSGKWLFSGIKTLSKCCKHSEHSGALIIYKLTKKNTPHTLLYGEVIKMWLPHYLQTTNYTIIVKNTFQLDSL